VLADGTVVGRIFKANAAPVGAPWMWSLAFGHHEDRTPTHGYAERHEDAILQVPKLSSSFADPAAPWSRKMRRGLLSLFVATATVSAVLLSACGGPQIGAPFEYKELSLGDQLRGLPAKYNRPDTLFLGTSSPVELVIQTGGEQTIDEMLKGFPGEVRTTTVRMANRASAYLTGPKDMVEITPRGDPLRTVTTDAPVSWIWDVRPLKPGRAQVVLEVFSQVKGGADEPRAQIRVLQDTWTIEAKGLEWVKYQIADIEPIRAFLFTLISAVVATLAYFGIKGWKTSKPSGDNT
jgi:hypothetical protein